MSFERVVITVAVDKDKNTQILVTFPNDMIKDIEEFWHDNLYKNRSEAIRELVLRGLKFKEQES